VNEHTAKQDVTDPILKADNRERERERERERDSSYFFLSDMITHTGKFPLSDMKIVFNRYRINNSFLNM